MVDDGDGDEEMPAAEEGEIRFSGTLQRAPVFHEDDMLASRLAMTGTLRQIAATIARSPERLFVCDGRAGKQTGSSSCVQDRCATWLRGSSMLYTVRS